MQTAGDLYECYKSFQRVHPHLGAMLTAEPVYVIGDFVSQLINDKRIDKKKLLYTAMLAPVYGICLEGLIETGEIVGRNLSENSLVKAALGPNLAGNLFNTFFFVNNTVGERNNYSVPELAKHYTNLLSSEESENKGIQSRWNNFKRNYVNNIPGKEFLLSTIATLSLWNVFQYWNYEYVDPEMRASTTLGAALIWTSILSLLSLRGRRKIQRIA